MKADRDTTLRKLKTVRGQIDGIIRMVEDDRYCIDISNQLMASIAILKNINKDVLEAHLRYCVLEAFDVGNPSEKAEKIEEIIGVIDKLTSK
ncbi:MAG: metal-sensing transcriptional repressor [Firmicutes bacterium]|nr:metal-sensing transcriptional repressor [Candidatus Fermentithermobacillaceae bacterium]HON87647.1 metal-sensing transcriptional repressor [Bacillota bacterium]HRC53811.1 metal-sensing transcriptional repressor [Bacillota bacterium]